MKLRYGVGYFGEGCYTATDPVTKKITKSYNAWSNMLIRCYDKSGARYHRYGGRGVIVCDEWLDYQVYAKWFHSNWKDGFEVDKDLKSPEAKMYSPKSCEFVPQRVNALMTLHNTKRGEYPVGVTSRKRKDRDVYRASCSDGGGTLKHLGYFDTPEQAFDAYKVFKEQVIKDVATEEFNVDNISEQVYNTLMDWEVIPYPE